MRCAHYWSWYLVSIVQPVNSSQQYWYIISRCVSLTRLHEIDFCASMGSFSGAPWARLPIKQGVGGVRGVRGSKSVFLPPQLLPPRRLPPQLLPFATPLAYPPPTPILVYLPTTSTHDGNGTVLLRFFCRRRGEKRFGRSSKLVRYGAPA